MKRKFHYATISEAISLLRQQGYLTDFNIKGNVLEADAEAFSDEDFEIMDVYRYEGNSDPADEAVVYAIISRSGVKGVLVMGYGDNSDTVPAGLLAKLHY